MNSISRLLVPLVLPYFTRVDRLWVRPLLAAFLPIAVLLTALISSAQTPAPPAGSLPSASRLQQLHDLGQQLGKNSFDAETVGPIAPKTENLEYHLDNYLKNEGASLSQTERDVLKDAYWQGVETAGDNFGGGMTQIDPPSLIPPNTAPTTIVSGKTTTPGPGTLQLTDKDGNTFFVDVDQNGNYSRTVPQSNFQPVKMTLRTGTLKAAWQLNEEGTWTQVSSASGTSGSQGAMAPGARITGSAAYALFDECKKPMLMASKETGTGSLVASPHESNRADRSPLRLVRLPGQPRLSLRQAEPLVHLVSDPLPPDAVREAQKQGIDHADQQFEKSQLEKIPNPTPEQQRRLDDLNKMLKDYDTFKSSPFSNPDVVKIAEDSAKARWLQRQAEALRTSGDPNLLPQANALDAEARKLLNGQTLPPLRASTKEPLQFSSASPGGRIVSPDQNGFALASARTSQSPQNATSVLKGHTTQVATGDIRQQQTTELALDSLVHLEESEPSETVSFPGYFGYNMLTGTWGKPDWSVAAAWTGYDAKIPFVTSIDTNGGFELTELKDLSKPCLTLNVGYEFDRVSTAIDSKRLDYAYNVTVNRNSSWIAGFKSGADVLRLQGDYMKTGAINNVQYAWTNWFTPFQEVPVISSGQISDEGYNRLSWESPFKNFMAYGELNPGVLPDPVPGLYPGDWPRTEAYPGVVLSMPGFWLEE